MTDIPTVTLNDNTTTHHSLTNEEELLQEMQDINKVDPEDKSVPTAVIVDKEEPNKLSLTPSNSDISAEEEEEEEEQVVETKPTTSKSPIPLPYHAEPTTVTTTTTATGNLDITSPIHKESDPESDSDDELKRITESNRFIPLDKAEPPTKKTSAKSLRSLDVSARKQLLVFADKPNISKTADRIIVKNHYGAGAEGKLQKDLRPKRKSREYLVACDFSDESYHAIEWTMGTMMRDGDKLHIVTAVSGEDGPQEAGLSLKKQVKKKIINQKC